jgi:hypothetical protein
MKALLLLIKESYIVGETIKAEKWIVLIMKGIKLKMTSEEVDEQGKILMIRKHILDHELTEDEDILATMAVLKFPDFIDNVITAKLFEIEIHSDSKLKPTPYLSPIGFHDRKFVYNYPFYHLAIEDEQYVPPPPQSVTVGYNYSNINNNGVMFSHAQTYGSYGVQFNARSNALQGILFMNNRFIYPKYDNFYFGHATQVRIDGKDYHIEAIHRYLKDNNNNLRDYFDFDGNKCENNP